MQRYRDRTEAGWRLAVSLAAYYGHPDVLALALTPGAAPVAHEVARALGAQLDVFLMRELPAPGHKGRPLGVISSGGLCLLNEQVVQRRRIPKEEIETLTYEAREELKRRVDYYRSGRGAPDLQDRFVILVDDGLSSGLTIRMAARALRQQQPARLIIAIPVAAASTLALFRADADQVICAVSPKPLSVASCLYDEPAEPTDQEVRNLIERARGRQEAPVERRARRSECA